MGNTWGSWLPVEEDADFKVQLLQSILVMFQDQHYFLSLLKLGFSMRKPFQNFPLSDTLRKKAIFWPAF